jgi:hypothetical protein
MGDSSSSDSEEDEGQKQLWTKIEGALEEYHLSPFALVACKKWVKLMADRDNTHLERVRDWLLLKINSRARAKPLNDWQLGCPEVVPGLRASPFWELSDPGLAWVKEIQDNFSVIKDELMELRHKGGFQPFRQPTWSTKIAAPDMVGSVSHDAGDWNVFYLFLHDEKFDENCEKCPRWGHPVYSSLSSLLLPRRRRSICLSVSLSLSLSLSLCLSLSKYI